MEILLFLAIFTIFGSLIGWGAQRRGRRFLVWFLFGGLSPLFGGLALLIVGDSPQKREAELASLAEQMRYYNLPGNS